MTTFSNPELQQKVDAMQARERTPEFQAKRVAELQQERRAFWRTYALLPAAMMLIGAGMTWALDIEVLPVGVLMTIVVPVVVGLMLYPRSNAGYCRRVGRRERMLKILGD